MKLLLMWCNEGKLTIILPLSTRVWQHKEIEKFVLNLWIFLKAEGMLEKLANTQWVGTPEWCILGKKKDQRNMLPSSHSCQSLQKNGVL